MISRSSQPTEWPSELSVFPLPRVVFFPHTVLPLRIFEARYQAMMKHCIAQQPMAMAVALLKPGYEADYDGRPDIHGVCTVGRIETYQELPNGHYHLLLRGIARAQLQELPASGLPFRQAHATPLDGKLHADAVTRDAMTTLLSTASIVAAAVRRTHPDFALGVAPSDPPYYVADTLADRLLADPAVRQDLLETLDVPQRIHKLTGHLAALLGHLEGGGRHGRGTLQ